MAMEWQTVGFIPESVSALTVGTQVAAAAGSEPPVGPATAGNSLTPEIAVAAATATSLWIHFFIKLSLGVR